MAKILTRSRIPGIFPVRVPRPGSRKTPGFRTVERATGTPQVLPRLLGVWAYDAGEPVGAGGGAVVPEAAVFVRLPRKIDSVHARGGVLGRSAVSGCGSFRGVARKSWPSRAFREFPNTGPELWGEGRARQDL